jgi:2-methylcitrate dehydratase PrpD
MRFSFLCLIADHSAVRPGTTLLVASNSVKESNRPSGADERLAGFAADLRFDRLPAEVIAHTKLSILDTIGVALAGSGTKEGCDDVLAYTETEKGSGGASVWPSGVRLGPAQAALANAVLARALDYDDIIEFPQIHVSVCVVPAAIALAQSRSAPIDGRRLIAAVAVGCEVQSRLAASLKPYFGEGLPTMLSSQVFGYFSAAAACGNILGLGHDAMRSAFGLALMQAAGTEEMVVHAAESFGKSLYAGLSNQGGVQSALMAQHGVLAKGEPLEGRAGLFAAYYGGRYDADVLVSDLGTRFVSLDRCVKAMPGTLVSHAFAEAALKLMQDNSLRQQDIAQVRLYVGPWGNVMCEPASLRRRPTSSSAAMNSIPFIVAKAIANGRVALDDFQAEGRNQAEALAIAAHTDHVLRRDLARPRGLEPGLVNLTLKDGRELNMRVAAPLGHPSRPLSIEDAAAKFRANARFAAKSLEPSRVDAMIERVLTLENIEDVTGLVELAAHKSRAG